MNLNRKKQQKAQVEASSSVVFTRPKGKDSDINSNGVDLFTHTLRIVSGNDIILVSVNVDEEGRIKLFDFEEKEYKGRLSSAKSAFYGHVTVLKKPATSRQTVSGNYERMKTYKRRR